VLEVFSVFVPTHFDQLSPSELLIGEEGRTAGLPVPDRDEIAAMAAQESLELVENSERNCSNSSAIPCHAAAPNFSNFSNLSLEAKLPSQ
jgi:hypothetical protein